MKATLKSITTPDICQYIAEFARVSTDRDTLETDAKKDLERCKRLWLDGHRTTFECISLDFLIEDVSRALLAQITRYRLMTFNVKSQRYCNESEAEMYIPTIIDFDDNESASIMRESYKNSQENYNKLIALKNKPEDARFVLPMATMTRFRVVMNLHEFFHFYEQRSSLHSQHEIRELANAMFAQIIISINQKGRDLLEFIRDSFSYKVPNLIGVLRIIMDEKTIPSKKIALIKAKISDYERFI